MKKFCALFALLLVACVASCASASVKGGIYFSQTWGLYIADVIENDGKITNVIIDRISANGKSSKELRDKYGIKPVSSIKKDWWEQAAHFESWLLQNGLDALKTDDKGRTLDVDLISGATINIAELSYAVQNAIDGKTEDNGCTIKTGSVFNDEFELYIANVIYKDGEIYKILTDRISTSGEDTGMKDFTPAILEALKK